MEGYIRRFVAGTGATVLWSLPMFAGTVTYKIDPKHSDAQFAVTHLMISKVRGEFHGINGTVVYDDADVSKSSVNVTIEASSVDTHEPDRDQHLRSADFFDVANHPLITFQSSKVESDGPDKLKVTGELTIRGNTRPVVLEISVPTAPIKDPWGMQRTAVSGTSKINRQDFGVAWNQALDSGGVVVGDNVEITLDVEMVVSPAAK